MVGGGATPKTGIAPLMTPMPSDTETSGTAYKQSDAAGEKNVSPPVASSVLVVSSVLTGGRDLP